jgi:hypothetical protein
MVGPMKLNRDFSEFFQSLNANGVRYLVVGGYAVAFYGHPRYTKDIDVWVDSTAENAKRVVAALADFGFASLGLVAKDFQESGKIIQLGIAPNRIDILTSLSCVSFDPCYLARKTAMLESVAVDFIDIESLKVNKQSTGRTQDLADVESLES